LRTLDLLQTRPGISAVELATRLGVTDRAARRYVAILREAGVTVESTRGPYGGYRLGRGVRPPPLVFTAAEALGTVMAVLDGHHAAADPDDPVGSALGKLIRALPEHIGQQAEQVRRHARAAPDRRAARPDPSIAGALVDAIAAGRCVHLTSRSESGSRWETTVDPWAVVVRHGRWYLICYAHRSDAPRAYRVDRLERLQVCEPPDCDSGRVPPPPDLDPVAWLEQHLATGWDYETHVVFEAPLDEVAPNVPSPMGRLEALDGGERCSLVGSTSNPAMYAGEWLAAIPHPFRVVGGPELRRAVEAVGRRMTAAARTVP